MVRVVIIHDTFCKIKGFKVSGHAGFSVSGEDIVCAAVSAIVFTALGGLDELAGFRNFKESDGWIECYVPNNLEEKQISITDIILETMVIGLKQIEADYGKYIQVCYEEV
ncbi:MAG TPA: ribosomal-processing cysteine protease Prp [Thermoclostridium sp.]|nr:ribosomal-processing cysteine protease Prp [Thermoclostridium sp.]